MKKQLILVLITFAHVAVFAQNSGEENLPENVRPEQDLAEDSPETNDIVVATRFDFGGILSPGYNPFGIGNYIIGTRKVLNTVQVRAELGRIKDYGFYYGFHLGLGQNFKIDNFDLYLTGNYGMTSIGVKEYKQHGRFLIWDYSVDLGFRYNFKYHPQLALFTEASYSGKKPIHIRLGIIIK